MGISGYNSSFGPLRVKQFKSELDEFQKGLNDWLADPHTRGDKQEAAKRIKETYYQNREYLDLSSLGIDTLPQGIGEFINLKELRLNYNEFTAIPPELLKLSSLNTLDLSDCKIQQLPANIDQMSQLEYLYLNNNADLSSLPEAICHIQSLRSAHFMGCKIKHLPPHLSNLQNLQVFDVTLNEIETIEENLDPTIFLCSGNPLKSVYQSVEFPYFPYPYLPPVSSLNAWYNDLTISGNKEMAKVRINRFLQQNNPMLDLSGLNLKSIPNSLFKVPNLKFIVLEKSTALPPQITELEREKILYREDLSPTHPYFNTYMSNSLNDWLSESGNKEMAKVRIDRFLRQKNPMLDLSGLNLKSIPNSLFKAPNLKYIVLEKSTALPPQITELEREKILYCEDLSPTHPYFNTYMSNSINEWLSDPSASGDKEQVAEKILEAYQDKYESLDFTYLDLNKLPVVLTYFNFLKKLKLVENQLEEIPPEIGNMTSLEKLQLGNNQLKEIPPEIGNMSSLKILHLGKNRLKEIPPEIGNMSNLKKLYIENNELKEIPPEIGNMTSLEELQLEYNKLKEIPHTLFKAPNLKYIVLEKSTALPPQITDLERKKILYREDLSLTHPYFTTYMNNSLHDLQFDPSEDSKNIDDTVIEISNAYYTKAKSIDLNNVNLKKIPLVLTYFNFLKKLILFENSLEEIPPEIGNLTSLETLSLDANELEEIPPEIGNLTSLVSLYLEGNQLKEIPPEIGNLTSLVSLYLEGNQLKELPPEIGNLTSLKELRLNSNQLKEIPSEIGNLTSLKELWLNSNQLKEIPSEIGNLTSLKELYLNNNQLKEIPPQIGNMTSLDRLYLINNQLKELPPEIGNLTSLKELWLNSNQLKEVPSEIATFRNIEKLLLENNQIESLPSTLGQMVKLKELQLKGNKELSDLPISLSNIESLLNIGTNETKIPDHTKNAILESCKKLRERRAADKLPSKVRLWFEIAQKELNFSALESFENMQKGHLYDWLLRLERTKDFQMNQQELAKVVCEIIAEMLENKDFQEIFFTQVEANNENCEDRAAMALNEIYTSMLLHKNEKDLKIAEKFKLLIGCAKTLALRSAVAKVLEQHQKLVNFIEAEGVQIYLYCETHLREILGLKTAIQSMRYTDIGNRNWVNQDKLIEEVKKTYVDFLITIPAFVKLLDTQKEELEATDNLDNQICELSLNPPKTDNQLSDEYLDWEKEVKNLNSKREELIRGIRKEWAIRKIKDLEIDL